MAYNPSIYSGYSNITNPFADSGGGGGGGGPSVLDLTYANRSGILGNDRFADDGDLLRAGPISSSTVMTRIDAYDGLIYWYTGVSAGDAPVVDLSMLREAPSPLTIERFNVALGVGIQIGSTPDLTIDPVAGVFATYLYFDSTLQFAGGFEDGDGVGFGSGTVALSTLSTIYGVVTVCDLGGLYQLAMTGRDDSYRLNGSTVARDREQRQSTDPTDAVYVFLAVGKHQSTAATPTGDFTLTGSIRG